jgi:hypothetical protein
VPLKPAGKALTQPEPFKLKSEALHEYEKRREATRRQEEEVGGWGALYDLNAVDPSSLKATWFQTLEPIK